MNITIQELVPSTGNTTGLERVVVFRAGAITMKQSISRVGSGEVRRALSGRALRVAPFEKYTTQVNGNGWQNPGLDDVNWKAPIRLKSMFPLCQQTSGGAVTPYRSARSDLSPYCFALTPTGLVTTTLSGNVSSNLTPAAVSGATAYFVYTYPILDGYATYTCDHDQTTGEFVWTIELQEK